MIMKHIGRDEKKAKFIWFLECLIVRLNFVNHYGQYGFVPFVGFSDALRHCKGIQKRVLYSSGPGNGPIVKIAQSWK